jgi:cysteinyl-tRNA synthetase
LVEERQKARQEKRWKDADTLREQVIAAGYEIEDTPQGPRVKHRRLTVAMPATGGKVEE